MQELDLFLPPWVDALPPEHPIKSGLYDAVRASTADLHHIREIDGAVSALGTSQNISAAKVLNMDLGTGIAMEIIQGITEAAKDLQAPLILQVSKGARAYANHTYLVKLVEAAVIECPNIPIVLHLDHGRRDRGITGDNISH